MKRYKKSFIIKLMKNIRTKDLQIFFTKNKENNCPKLSFSAFSIQWVFINSHRALVTKLQCFSHMETLFSSEPGIIAYLSLPLLIVVSIIILAVAPCFLHCLDFQMGSTILRWLSIIIYLLHISTAFVHTLFSFPRLQSLTKR